VPVGANAQPALAFYAWDRAAGAYLPFAINVISLNNGLISDVTAFIIRTTDVPNESFTRCPEQPMDDGRLGRTFERFGLPSRVS
jgi:hypothetical protein